MITSGFETSNFEINVFPNPTSTFINITANDELNFKVTLYNINGRIMASVINSRQLKIDLLASGVYLLELEAINSGRRIVKK